MNGQERAIEQAVRYWRAQGIPLEGFALVAHRVPVEGSVWWVEAFTAGERYDVLVSRQKRHAFRFTPHCPWGYTIYACHATRETPIEVVDYEEIARRRIEALTATARYQRGSLVYLANPSAAWRDASRAQLATKEARLEENHRQRGEARREVRAKAPIRSSEPPRSWPLPPLSHNERALGVTHALSQAVFGLFAQAFADAGIICTPAMGRNLRKRIAARVQGERCLPLGCMWTPVRCLLFIPADIASHYELGCWMGWKERSYCLWFDGGRLRECSYNDLKCELEVKSPY